MIPSLFLSLALIAVDLPTYPDPADLSRARDLAFEAVQVEWIASTTKVRSLESVLPREHAELVRLLGHPDSLVRRLAADELIRLGDGASTALAWGMRVKDAEIASASSRLRGRLFACRPCGGTGDCPACRDDPLQWTTGRCPDDRCRACTGTGDVRWEMRREWIDGAGWGGEYVWCLVERDLYR